MSNNLTQGDYTYYPYDDTGTNVKQQWDQLLQQMGTQGWPTGTGTTTSSITIGATNDEIIDAIKRLEEQSKAIFNMLRLILTTQLEEELKKRAKKEKTED